MAKPLPSASAPTKSEAPTDADALRTAILARYEKLPKRLQQVARYVLDEPNAVALETLAVLAQRCGVQPSAIVRFAKTFGFDGASAMQRLFRDNLLSGAATPIYSERVRQITQKVEKKSAEGTPGAILAEFIEANALTLRSLSQAISETDMAAAARHIASAETVYVVGYRHSFPVATYLAYALQEANKRAALIDGVAGLGRQQAQTIGPKDLLIAVSVHPYADETVEIVDTAIERGARVLTISDSLVSPVAKPATLVLQVRESEVRKLRSLTASLCLAQALVVSFAFDSAKAKPPPPGAGEDTRRPGRRGRFPV